MSPAKHIEVGSGIWRATIAEQAPTTEASFLLPQTRAIELCLPPGFVARDAPRLIWQVKRAGFNTILLSCVRHGYTAFPSATMRACGFPGQDPRLSEPDPVAPVLKVAGEEGLTVYALVEGLKVGHGERGRGPVLRHRPEWAARGRDRFRRADDPPFLCPANRDVWRFLGDLFYEVLEGYAFQGLYIRHLHFPLEPSDGRQDYCRCDNCRRAVRLSLGVKIADIPDDLDHPDRYNLTSWRGQQLTGLLHYLQLRAAKTRARTLTLAEVYLDESDEGVRSESHGFVDACAWTQERLVPIAAFRPLPGKTQSSESWIKRVAGLAQCALVLPVLSASRDGRLVETLERLALEPIAGVVVCEPHDLTAPPLVHLANGPWSEPTQVAENRPLISVAALLRATVKLLRPDDPVRSFLSDVLRVVEPFGERWVAPQRESLYENLLGLEERILDERVNLGAAAPAVIRDFRLARQLLQLVDIES
jgi:hypothetical protein